MIQCDEVFDILTRGPFPTGAPSDGVVESHLTHCRGCRELAEALRPAIELFQEAVTPEESRNLPSYWGESGSNLAPWLTLKENPPSRVAQRRLRSLPRQLCPPIPMALPRWSLRPFARIAAAIVLGMALAGLLRRLGSDEHASGERTALATAGTAHWRLPDDPWAWSAQMKLGRTCSNEVHGAMLVASLDGGNAVQAPFRQACCTACHAVGSEGPKTAPQTALQIVKACTACHGEAASTE